LFRLAKECIMRITVVVATTNVDLQHDRLTKNCLEDMAKQANGGRAIQQWIEHDRTLPPMGKTLRAWVEPMGDVEYKLVMESVVFEEEKEIRLPDGTMGILQESDSDHRPFVRSLKEVEGDVDIAYDPANFESDSELKAFQQEIRTGADFSERYTGRKSLIPDPEVIISLGKAVMGYFIVRRVLDKGADKLVEAVSNDVLLIYSKLKVVIESAAKYCVPKNRPITYVIAVPGDSSVALVAQTRDARMLMSALEPDKLSKALEQAEQWRTALQAEHIQFSLSTDGDWEFSFLLTVTGQVIGTRKTYSRRARRLELMEAARATKAADSSTAELPSITASLSDGESWGSLAPGYLQEHHGAETSATRLEDGGASSFGGLDQVKPADRDSP
jgi:hypothetical protein